MPGELVPIVVRGASTDELAASLEQLDVVGSVIDGEQLGIDGAVVARLVGEDDDVLVVDAEGVGSSMAVEAVRAHLVKRWSDADVGDAAADRHGLCWPVMRVQDARTVAITRPADLMLAVFAKAADVTLHEARVGDRLLVGIAEGHGMHVDVLVDVLVNAKGRSVVLWRDGSHTALHVMKRGKSAAAHLWEPTWTPIGQASLDELRDPGVTGDAATIGRLLDLPAADVVSLRAMMRRPEPDLEQVARLLDLPSEAIDVLEGRTSVAELPDGHTPKPASLLQEIARGSEHDPSWMRWLDGGARELRPWYVISSLASLVVGAMFLTRGAIGGDSSFWRVVGLVMVLGTVIDLPVRWWAKRRRTS